MLTRDLILSLNKPPTSKMTNQIQVSADQEGAAAPVPSTIRTYAERNKIAHSNLKYLIANQRWAKLAQLMVRDRECYPVWSHYQDTPDLGELERVLNRAQDKFFKVLEPNGDYEFSEYARNLHNEQQRKKKERDDAAERERLRLEKKKTNAERRSRRVSEEIRKSQEAKGSIGQAATQRVLEIKRAWRTTRWIKLENSSHYGKYPILKKTNVRFSQPRLYSTASIHILTSAAIGDGPKLLSRLIARDSLLSFGFAGGSCEWNESNLIYYYYVTQKFGNTPFTTNLGDECCGLPLPLPLNFWIEAKSAKFSLCVGAKKACNYGYVCTEACQISIRHPFLAMPCLSRRPSRLWR